MALLQQRQPALRKFERSRSGSNKAHPRHSYAVLTAKKQEKRRELYERVRFIRFMSYLRQKVMHYNTQTLYLCSPFFRSEDSNRDLAHMTEAVGSDEQIHGLLVAFHYLMPAESSLEAAALQVDEEALSMLSSLRRHAVRGLAEGRLPPRYLFNPMAGVTSSIQLVQRFGAERLKGAMQLFNLLFPLASPEQGGEDGSAAQPQPMQQAKLPPRPTSFPRFDTELSTSEDSSCDEEDSEAETASLAPSSAAAASSAGEEDSL